MGQAWTEGKLLTERGRREGLARRVEGFCQQPCGTTRGRVWLLAAPAGLKRDRGPRWSLLSQQVVSSSLPACRELVWADQPLREEMRKTSGRWGCREGSWPCHVVWGGLGCQGGDI